MAQYRSKRYRAAADKRDRAKTYPLAEAIAALKAMPAPKFDQTVTIAFRLGVDPKQFPRVHEHRERIRARPAHSKVLAEEAA